MTYNYIGVNAAAISQPGPEGQVVATQPVAV